MNMLWNLIVLSRATIIPLFLVVLMGVLAWFEGRRSAFEEIARRDAGRLMDAHEAIGRLKDSKDPTKDLEAERWLRD